LKCSTCESHYTRPSIGSHILSRSHAADLKAALLPNAKRFLSPATLNPAYFTNKEGKTTSICFGCSTAWVGVKAEHLNSCKQRDRHFTKLRQLLDIEETPEEPALPSDERLGLAEARIKELEAQLAAQRTKYEDQLKKRDQMLNAMEESSKETDENEAKYYKWLGIITGAENAADWSSIVEAIENGSRKSLEEMSKAPPSAPPAPKPKSQRTVIPIPVEQPAPAPQVSQPVLSEVEIDKMTLEQMVAYNQRLCNTLNRQIQRDAPVASPPQPQILGTTRRVLAKKAAPA